MKTLTISSKNYAYLLKGFTEFLSIMGYAPTTINTMPIHVREFLHYMEQQNIQHIRNVTPKAIDDFFYYLNHRANKRNKGTALSSAAINKSITALQLFARYLNNNGNIILSIPVQREIIDTLSRNIVSITEIKQIYQATFLPNRNNSTAIGQRDRALLAVYYGCGLRRTEGIALNLNDVDLERKLLFVRKGKGNKQRYVPIAQIHYHDLKTYIQEGREWFLQEHYSSYQQERYGKPYTPKNKRDTQALFIGQRGTRIRYPELQLKRICTRAALDKPITLHGLRHSIATHLLEGGMPLENIAQFLGHSSLSSTQIYTHILQQNQHHENDT